MDGYSFYPLPKVSVLSIIRCLLTTLYNKFLKLAFNLSMLNM